MARPVSTQHPDAASPGRSTIACGLIILVVILLAGRRKVFDGFQFYLACLLYAGFRFAVDFTRYYAPNDRVGMLSHNQVVCILLFAVCAVLILRNLRSVRHALEQAPAQ